KGANTKCSSRVEFGCEWDGRALTHSRSTWVTSCSRLTVCARLAFTRCIGESFDTMGEMFASPPIVLVPGSASIVSSHGPLRGHEYHVGEPTPSSQSHAQFEARVPHRS